MDVGRPEGSKRKRGRGGYGFCNPDLCYMVLLMLRLTRREELMDYTTLRYIVLVLVFVTFHITLDVEVRIFPVHNRGLGIRKPLRGAQWKGTVK